MHVSSKNKHIKDISNTWIDLAGNIIIPVFTSLFLHENWNSRFCWNVTKGVFCTSLWTWHRSGILYTNIYQSFCKQTWGLEGPRPWTQHRFSETSSKRLPSSKALGETFEKNPAMAKHCAAKRALLAVIFVPWRWNIPKGCGSFFFFGSNVQVVEKDAFYDVKRENTLVKWNLCWWRTVIRCDTVNQWMTFFKSLLSVRIVWDSSVDAGIPWLRTQCDLLNVFFSQIFTPTVVFAWYIRSRGHENSCWWIVNLSLRVNATSLCPRLTCPVALLPHLHRLASFACPSGHQGVMYKLIASVLWRFPRGHFL